MTGTIYHQPSWKIRDIFIILIIINIAGISIGQFSEPLMSLVKIIFVNHSNPQIIFFFFASLIQASLFIGFAVYYVVYHYGGTLGELGLTKYRWYDNFKKGIIGGLALFCIVVGAGAVVTYFFPIDPEPQPFAQLIMNLNFGPELILPLIMGSILAPVGEEIFFRGLVYPVFRQRFGVALGIIISSVIFATLHFDLIRMIPIALGGMGLAWLYERTGSLITCITAHSVWNTIMTLLIIFVGIT